MHNHNNKSTNWYTLVLLPGVIAVLVAGCTALPARQAADAALVVQNENALLLEVTQGGFSINAQATQLGAGESLLYIWAEAGDSGRSGRELATVAVEMICEELGVDFERIDY